MRERDWRRKISAVVPPPWRQRTGVKGVSLAYIQIMTGKGKGYIYFGGGAESGLRGLGSETWRKGRVLHSCWMLKEGDR